MPTYLYDHIHLRSRDPKGTAQFYERLSDARIIESVQADGTPRNDFDLNGLTVFIACVGADEAMPDSPAGLDHFGLRVGKLEQTAELKRRGGWFSVERHTIRPGVKIALLECPDNLRIERAAA